MGRWEPGTRGRLLTAAAELFAEQGYERTTVAAIAERAGSTERTFFRHFTDKREVLFSGFEEVEAELAEAVASAPAELTALEAAVAGMREVAVANFAGERETARWRTALIEANGELRERELLKLAGVAVALATALRSRGVPAAEATLVADGALAVFRVAVTSWLATEEDRDLGELIDGTLARFRALVSVR